jgi:hypothetical protein
MHTPEHRLALGARASGDLVALGDDERLEAVGCAPARRRAA